MKVFIIEINCSCHKCQLETICQPFGIVHTISPPPAFIIKVSLVAKKNAIQYRRALCFIYIACAGEVAYTQKLDPIYHKLGHVLLVKTEWHIGSPFHVMSYSPVWNETERNETKKFHSAEIVHLLLIVRGTHPTKKGVTFGISNPFWPRHVWQL